MEYTVNKKRGEYSITFTDANDCILVTLYPIKDGNVMRASITQQTKHGKHVIYSSSYSDLYKELEQCGYSEEEVYVAISKGVTYINR